LKPTCLSGSRGVIRANDTAQFVEAFAVIQSLLATVGSREILVEAYIPGREFTVEARQIHGNAHNPFLYAGDRRPACRMIERRSGKNASLGFLALGCIAALWLASRIYRVGLLMYGKRPTMKEMARWVSYAR